MTTKTPLLVGLPWLFVPILFSVQNIEKCGAVKIFEFGVDYPSAMIVAQTNGTMGMLERLKTVPLRVLPCFEVTYVNVNIHNSISTPTVTFDKLNNYVVMAYGWYQSSYSSYYIYAKGYRNPEIPNCYSNIGAKEDAIVPLSFPDNETEIFNEDES